MRLMANQRSAGMTSVARMLLLIALSFSFACRGSRADADSRKPLSREARASSPQEPTVPEAGTRRGQPPTPQIGVASSDPQALPEDVAEFKKRRDLCDHFRGEEPYDEERRRFLTDQSKKYCTGTDAELRRLKAKYKTSVDVSRALEAYEDNVE